MKRIARAFAGYVFAVALVLPAHAQVTVDDPWVRATVVQQRATGAFMRITSAQDARLVEVRSPIAGAVEIHQMTMDKDIMKMRVLPNGLDLPAGKTVELKSGGYHVMLMDLKQPVQEGATVPLTLLIEKRDRQRIAVDVKASAKALTGGGHMGRMDHSQH